MSIIISNLNLLHIRQHDPGMFGCTPIIYISLCHEVKRWLNDNVGKENWNCRTVELSKDANVMLNINNMYDEIAFKLRWM